MTPLALQCQSFRLFGESLMAAKFAVAYTLKAFRETGNTPVRDESPGKRK